MKIVIKHWHRIWKYVKGHCCLTSSLRNTGQKDELRLTKHGIRNKHPRGATPEMGVYRDDEEVTKVTGGWPLSLKELGYCGWAQNGKNKGRKGEAMSSKELKTQWWEKNKTVDCHEDGFCVYFLFLSMACGACTSISGQSFPSVVRRAWSPA